MKRFFNGPIIIVLVLMLIMNFIDGDFSNPLDWIIDKLLLLPAIVIGLSFHEFAHGWASNMLGDPTPKAQGRLTLNPFAHFDPIGFISLLFVGFGWGIPVEIDPRYYKHPRRDELIVSFAGVTMNLLVSVLFCFVIKIYASYGTGFIQSTPGYYLLIVFQNVIVINLVLMIFNLIPVPPLDGFGIITQIFNLRNTQWYYKVYDKGFIILLVLILFGITDKILTPCVSYLYNLLVNLIIL